MAILIKHLSKTIRERPEVYSAVCNNHGIEFLSSAKATSVAAQYRSRVPAERALGRSKARCERSRAYDQSRQNEYVNVLGTGPK